MLFVTIRERTPSVAFEALSSTEAMLLHMRRAALSLQRPVAAMAGAVPGRRGAPPSPLAADGFGEGGRTQLGWGYTGITEAATQTGASSVEPVTVWVQGHRFIPRPFAAGSPGQLPPALD